MRHVSFLFGPFFVFWQPETHRDPVICSLQVVGSLLAFEYCGDRNDWWYARWVSWCFFSLSAKVNWLGG